MDPVFPQQAQAGTGLVQVPDRQIRSGDPPVLASANLVSSLVTATFIANGPGSAGTSRLSAPVIAESEDTIFADRFE